MKHFIINKMHGDKKMYLRDFIDMSFIGGRSPSMTPKKEEARKYLDERLAYADAKEVGKTALVETVKE